MASEFKLNWEPAKWAQAAARAHELTSAYCQGWVLQLAKETESASPFVMIQAHLLHIALAESSL